MFDDIHGIHGMVPPELLHKFGNGVNELVISTFDIGVKNRNKADKKEFNKFHHRIYHFIERQLESVE